MSIRYKRWLFRVTYILIGTVLSMTALSGTLEAIIGWFFFVVCSFSVVRLAVWLEVVLFRYTRCTACGVCFDLVDRWRCACGYISQTYRHLFRGCPRCHTVFPYVKCPRCGVSVDL